MQSFSYRQLYYELKALKYVISAAPLKEPGRDKLGLVDSIMVASPQDQ
jgi:hypothetical protein